MNALAILILLASPAAGPSIGLNDALEAAAAAPGPRAADARAEAARRGAAATRRSALLPIVAVGAEYRRIHEPLRISTPIGPFQTEPERVLGVGVDVTQPIFSPQPLLYGGPAAEATARAASLQAKRARQERARQAGAAWLAVKRIDAQRAATAAFVASLTERLRVMDALVDAGRGLEADRLKITLALDQAKQDLAALGTQRPVALARLGQALGRDGPVDVAGEPTLAAPPGDASRPDLAALDAQMDAARTRQRGVYGELWPRVELFGRARYADTDLVPDRRWVEGGVALTWVAFAGGTRGARADAIDAEARAIAAQREDAERDIALQIRSARAALDVAQGQLAVARRGVEQATASLDLEQRRYAGERATMNDVVAAEATLRERRTRRDLAALDVTEAELTLRLAEGRL